MKKEDAARKSLVQTACRQKDDGGLMFWEWDGKFWTQTAGGHVKKFGGGLRVQELDDWFPVASETMVGCVWSAKHGEPPVPEWSRLAKESQSGLVYRMEGDRHVIRNQLGETWREVSFNHEMVRVTNGFRNYNGWGILPLFHPVLDHYTNEGDRFPFRNPAFAPESIRDNPTELGTWVATGTSPTLDAWKAKCDKEIEEHNAKIAKPKGIFFVPSKPPEPYTDEALSEAWPLSSTSQSEVLKELGPMTAALADGIKAMVAIGENATAKELAMSLKYLIGNASFLLRTDRGHHAKR